MSNWWSAHTHSNYSALDGMSKVDAIVAKAASLGQPAIGLTDHGNMAGTVQLYRAAKRHGIVPFPGIEAYLLDPSTSPEDKGAGRFHIGLLALDLVGYVAIKSIVDLSHTRPRFNRFPRILLDDLIELSEGAGNNVALLTGCYYGYAQQMLIREGSKTAEGVVKTYASLFPHTIVELQNHSICHDHDGELSPKTDEDIVNHMVNIANRLGLPVLATQDSHYLDQNDKAAHALMKRMVYGGVEDEFPGDSFHVASSEWVADHYDEKTWAKVEEGAGYLLSLNSLSMPALDTFKVHVPEVSRNPMGDIGRICAEALDSYPPAKKKQKKYHDRLMHELDVWKALGMANYAMLVRDYVEWCLDKEICIEARGSANASLVCFLLGITQVDPIKWGLDENAFSRFLSKDRIKPPDIDMDVEDEQRERLIGYLERSFDTMRIGTWGKLGVRDDGKGSVLETYKTYKTRKIADKEKRQRVRGRYQTIADVKRHDPDDYPHLVRLGEMNSVYKSYGMHAGGILLSGKDQKISDYVPHMLIASSNMHVSQFDMDDVEQFGFLKLDVLGQATLTVMRICQELMGRDNPSDFSWIPENDSDACKILREGRVDNGIFHFEGMTKAIGGKQMGIRSTMDAVLAQALFMPGAMNTGQTDAYLERRKDPEKRARVRYIHPVFESALKDTYGAVIFQEQVTSIMRGLGMSIEGVNNFLKIVKDSGSGSADRNSERLQKAREEFESLCIAAGIAEKDIDKAWDSTAGFARYGFNRAHATGYGLRSYRCAYLKAHYPLEFMTALLQVWAGKDKEVVYTREARRMGIRVLAPDVNVSTLTWTLDRKAKAIRRGIVSIKGVGIRAAESIEANAPYASVQELIEKTDPKAVTGGKDYAKDGTLIGVLAKLRDAGALRSII